MKHDIIIVGGGLAGIVAAHGASKEGAKVLLLDRGSLGVGTNSAMANGFFSAPGPDESAASYTADTVAIGKALNVRWMVEHVAEHAEEAFEEIRDLDFVWHMQGPFYVFSENAPDKVRGGQMMRTLARATRADANVRAETGCAVSEILKDEHGCVHGVVAAHRDGSILTHEANAVILATGGAGAIYRHSDNHRAAYGHGYHLAMKTGLELRDIELVQFFPLLLNEPHLKRFMLYPSYPPESRLVNDKGQDLLLKYGLDDLNVAIKRNRDELAAHLYREGTNGDTFMDFTAVPEPAWDRYPMAMLKRFRFDFRSSPVKVCPGAHFFNGGVVIDRSAQTEVEGLFACGEVVGGLHGANRRGGNALTECVVFGLLAGREAARYARAKARNSSRGPREVGHLRPHETSSRGKHLRNLMERLQDIAWKRAGVVRSLTDLKEGYAEVSAIQEELEGDEPKLLIEHRALHDARAAASVLAAVISASMGRAENRGCFLRSDVPTDPQLPPAHSRLYRAEDGTFRCTYQA